MYRLLIVEDEEYTAKAIQSLISRKCPNINTCGIAIDGSEALELAAETKPDIVVSDIRMSNVDGLEFVGRMREKGISAKVIILTGYAEFEYACKALKLEVFEYILKPV